MKSNDLLERTFLFGINCLKFCRKLPNDPEYRMIRFQLENLPHHWAPITKNLRLDHPEQILRIKSEFLCVKPESPITGFGSLKH